RRHRRAAPARARARVPARIAARLDRPAPPALRAGARPPPRRHGCPPPSAPALSAAAIDIAALVVVRTASHRETLWAAEQALASNACGAVLAWLPQAKYAELRRLQIAAARGRAPAFLFRPPETASESSPAALRIALGTAGGGLAVAV